VLNTIYRYNIILVICRILCTVCCLFLPYVSVCLKYTVKSTTQLLSCSVITHSIDDGQCNHTIYRILLYNECLCTTCIPTSVDVQFRLVSSVPLFKIHVFIFKFDNPCQGSVYLTRIWRYAVLSSAGCYIQIIDKLRDYNYWFDIKNSSFFQFSKLLLNHWHFIGEIYNISCPKFTFEPSDILNWSVCIVCGTRKEISFIKKYLTRTRVAYLLCGYYYYIMLFVLSILIIIKCRATWNPGHSTLRM